MIYQLKSYEITILARTMMRLGFRSWITNPHQIMSGVYFICIYIIYICIAIPIFSCHPIPVGCWRPKFRGLQGWWQHYCGQQQPGDRWSRHGALGQVGLWDFSLEFHGVFLFFFFSIYIGRYKENYDILEEIIAKTWLVPCFLKVPCFFVSQEWFDPRVKKVIWWPFQWGGGSTGWHFGGP